MMVGSGDDIMLRDRDGKPAAIVTISALNRDGEIAAAAREVLEAEFETTASTRVEVDGDE